MNKFQLLALIRYYQSNMSYKFFSTIGSCKQYEVTCFGTVCRNSSSHIGKIDRRPWDNYVETTEDIGYKTRTIKPDLWISGSISVRRSYQRFCKIHVLLRMNIFRMDLRSRY